MSKPLIGVSLSFNDKDRAYQLAETYIESVKKAGGIPVLLPHTPEDAASLAVRCDGLLISGGPDMDPAYFDEQPIPQIGAICPERDESEVALLKAFMDAGKPVLGICRGSQILNVVFGGTLYQDLYSQYKQEAPIKHVQQGPRWYTSHGITVEKGTKLEEIFGDRHIGVNSFHHQAVKDVAPGFVVAAKAPDGVIEAIEKPDHPFCIGVQWHPECMFEQNTPFDKLFETFIAACRA